jgi:hypothetical protein
MNVTPEQALAITSPLDAITQSKAAKYESQYGDYMQIAADALKSKFEYDWTQNDTLAFGDYAKNWESYIPVFEADLTSRSAIGPALQSNLGMIALANAALPIQNLASVQALSDEAGTVYFRKGVAVNDHGTVKKGDQLLGAFGQVNQNIESFVSESQVQSTPAVVGKTDYDFTLGAEVRPGTVRVSVAGGKFKAIDDGEGHLLGVNVDAAKSTINYTTGAAKLVLVDVSGITGTETVDLTYQHSVIDSDNIPTMKWMLTNKTVNADYFILQSQYSNLSEIVLRKRFGADLSNQITNDLVSQITSAVMYKAIAKLRAAAIRNELALGSTITFAAQAATGVSNYDHRRTFDDKLIEATAAMYKLAGKGDVTTLVVGMKGKQILRTCGMRVISNAVSGPHLCGMYDNVPVYYAPNTVLGDNEILAIYRGQDWFESALVYAPFLPVTTVSGSATDNVLTNAQAAYHSAAIENVVDGFCVRITIQ